LSAYGGLDPVETKLGSTIENFHMIAPGQLYRGARPSETGIEALAQAGIKTVIDLQGGDTLFDIPLEKGETDAAIAQEASYARANGIQFISEPLSSVNPDFDDQAGRIEIILRLISDPARQPLYFHCRHGSDRTGLVAALYRVLDQGCTPAQAHEEMMKYGHTRYLPWIDRFFEDRVKRDSLTNVDAPAASCPLSG
jgi:protein tyrosine/serine phosphatase